MDDIERITMAKNSVGLGFAPGKNNPISLKTNNTSVYRVTGLDQIQDIIHCGYVRPKENAARGNIVYWSIGGDQLNYYDRRPVIEASRELVEGRVIGAISIDELTAIWIFDPTINKYINNINEVKELYCENKKQNEGISR